MRALVPSTRSRRAAQLKLAFRESAFAFCERRAERAAPICSRQKL
jgi:hypothetical protein